MMSVLMKRVALVATGAALLTLGVSSEAQAIFVGVGAATDGLDSGFDRLSETNSFFQVGYQPAPNQVVTPDAAGSYVESIEFRLRGGGDTDAAFDNQELTIPFQPAVGNVGGTLSAGDIFFDALPGTPANDPVERNSFANAGNETTSLKVNFNPGSFTLGSFFTFGVDTNAVGDDSLPFLSFLNPIFGDDVTSALDQGGDFGNAGVEFLATIVNGSQTITSMTNFLFESPTRSVATAGTFLAPSAWPPAVPGTFVTANSNAATAVPTPALLPGLLGFGASLLKKRRKLSAKAS